MRNIGDRLFDVSIVIWEGNPNIQLNIYAVYFHLQLSNHKIFLLTQNIHALNRVLFH